MATRRQFLKMVPALPFLAVALSVHPARAAPAQEPIAPEAQPWQFPLQFPAYFIKERSTPTGKRIHKVFLPLGV